MGQMYLTKNGLVTTKPMEGVYSISVKAYYEKYDLQGEDVFVGQDIINEGDWREAKKHLADDYINNFTIKNYPLSGFGKGHYKDNKKNRLLGRVGKEYNRGKELIEEIGRVLTAGDYDIKNEQELKKEIKNNLKQKIYEKYNLRPVESATLNQLASISSGRLTGAKWFEGEVME